MVNSLVQEEVKKDSVRNSSKEELSSSKKTNSSFWDSLNEEPQESVSIKEGKPDASESKKNNSRDKQELLGEANSPVSPMERRVEPLGTDGVVISKNASISPNAIITENENDKPGNSLSMPLKADMIEDGKTKGDTRVTRESNIPNELPSEKQSLPLNNESYNDIHLRDTSLCARKDSEEENPSVYLSPVSPSGGNPILLQAHLALVTKICLILLQIKPVYS